MGEYARAIRARVGDGIASHGTLRAYIHDFRASFKLFEMVVAELMTRKHGRPFRLWEDIALEVKDERGLPHPDTGIDVTDATTTIVQCKLRTKTLTWHDCATFLACALGRTDGEDGEDGTTSAFCVPWQNIVVARNACSRVTRHYAFYASKLKFDTPISLDDVESELLMLAAVATTETVANNARIEHMELRDFQLEAIDLCVRETARAAYIVLPTGCGKSLIMAHVAARVDGRTLILVPFISLLDQTSKVLSTIGIAATAV
jgi:predicted helicase